MARNVRSRSTATYPADPPSRNLIYFGMVAAGFASDADILRCLHCADLEKMMRLVLAFTAAAPTPSINQQYRLWAPRGPSRDGHVSDERTAIGRRAFPL